MEDMDYPDRPQRFDVCPQLLCTRGLTERHYWEAEWSGAEVVIGAAFGSIERKDYGASCKIGLNAESYGLWCEGGRLIVRHKLNKTEVRIGASDCRRVGVYLDWPAGTLSFYSVSASDSAPVHLHTFLSRVGDPPKPGFPEALYPGFWLKEDATVSLIKVM
ncbi:cytolytic toxin-beta-like [Engraulis encrasicolus]|uniref:cytolytic toxin-beta-like n=1 Tax=Engraulis encrasicolus TaxID=184585 RepID=UPI002FD3B65B